VQQIMRGMEKKERARQPRRADALDTATVRAMIEDLPPGLAGVRDSAMVLVGYGLGLRSRELVNLDVEHLTFTSRGLDVYVAWSKTDQIGDGITLALPQSPRDATDPVRAVRAWLDLSGLTGGPLFRNVDRHGNLVPPGRVPCTNPGHKHDYHERGGRMSRQVVGQVIRRACRRAGITAADFSAHSLRRGFATTAYALGMDEKEISRTGRWLHLATQRRYDASGRWAKPAGGLDL
jgi:integrase